jgi:hypothetical protein
MLPSHGPQTSSQPTIVYTDDQHVTGVIENVLVSYSLAEPTRGYLDNWILTARTIMSKGKMAALIVIDSEAKPPSDEIRVEINAKFQKLRDGIAAVAVVVEGRGFVAAAKRSAISLLTLLSRYPFPFRIFGDIVEGSSWLSAQLHQSMRSAAIKPKDLTVAAEIVRRKCKH